MTAGDCFYGVLPGSGKIPHYWLVLCAPCPAGFVAVVNFTTPNGSPQAHVVKQGFFPTLDYDSEVAWSYAAVWPVDAIKKAVAAGLFCTPAMQAGLTNHVWELSEVIALLDIVAEKAA